MSKKVLASSKKKEETKNIVCRYCGSSSTASMKRETLNVKSMPIEETVINCASCNRSYTI